MRLFFEPDAAGRQSSHGKKLRRLWLLPAKIGRTGMRRPVTDSMVCKRYEIYWIDLDPARGSEMRKTRPAVIVSMDVLNCALETVVVCPLTSKLHPGWRTRLPVKVLGKAAEIAADQIRTVSTARVRKKIGKLSDTDSAALCRLLGELYADG